MTNSRRQNLLALTIYALAATTMLAVPAKFGWHDTLICTHSTDPSIFIWSLAWWPWALLHGVNPILTKVIWSPVGWNLLWATSVPSVSLVMAPITILFGPIVSYNVVAWGSPLLGAWAAYLLCREITLKFWPALFGGWIFGYSSYEFQQLGGDMHLFVTFAIPLLVWLYILHWWGKVGRAWYVTLTTGLVVFQFGVSTEVFATLLSFGLLAVVAAVAFAPADDRRRHLATLTSLLFALGVTTILLGPCLYYIFFKHYVHGSILSPQHVVNDPFSYLFSASTGWGLYSWLAQVGLSHLLSPLHGEQSGVYLGWPVIVMALLFIREFISNRNARLLIFMLAVVFIAGLGPRLHLPVHVPRVILPWSFFVHLPLLDKALPARFSLYVSLTTALVAAWWLAASTGSRLGKISLALLAVIFLWPPLCSGLWVEQPPNPSFFSSSAVEKYLPRGANVLIFPYGPHGWSMLWQAESHFHFSMAGGYIFPVPPTAFSQWPILAAFSVGHGDGADYGRQLRAFIRATGIAAIIIPLNDHRDDRSLVSPLHLHPIITGGVRLYLLRQTDPVAVHGTP